MYYEMPEGDMIEVFYLSAEDLQDPVYKELDNDGNPLFSGPGWYWWPCLPGCLPDGDPIGPFETEHKAKQDAGIDPEPGTFGPGMHLPIIADLN